MAFAAWLRQRAAFGVEHTVFVYAEEIAKFPTVRQDLQCPAHHLDGIREEFVAERRVVKLGQDAILK